MRSLHVLVASLAGAVAVANVMVFAQPAEESATRPVRQRAIRLTQPWSKVTDLSDEQKQQLFDIHQEAVAKIKAIQTDERERCMAVLSEDQRHALEETLEREAAERKKPKTPTN